MPMLSWISPLVQHSVRLPHCFHAGASTLFGRYGGERPAVVFLNTTADPWVLSKDPQTHLEALSTSLQQMMRGILSICNLSSLLHA